MKQAGDLVSVLAAGSGAIGDSSHLAVAVRLILLGFFPEATCRSDAFGFLLTLLVRSANFVSMWSVWILLFLICGPISFVRTVSQLRSRLCDTTRYDTNTSVTMTMTKRKLLCQVIRDI